MCCATHACLLAWAPLVALISRAHPAQLRIAVPSFRVPCVRARLQLGAHLPTYLCVRLPSNSTSRSTRREDPTSGSVAARQCTPKAAGPCRGRLPAGPSGLHPSTRDGRQDSFGRRGREPNGRACACACASASASAVDGPIIKTSSLGQHSPLLMSWRACQDATTTLASLRHQAGVAEVGGRKLESSRRSQAPGGTQAYQSRMPNGSFEALGCPAQTLQFHLSRTACLPACLRTLGASCDPREYCPPCLDRSAISA